ncbi:MAG: hypothetical protein CSA24_02550 [Deltaproteobacteria bacterium]|nr:MAG: hypothetical protein CSA24_02550 [Deltaproteobacteria bacterium]
MTAGARALTARALARPLGAARRGLTIIELMVVMGLVALLIGVGTVAIGAIGSADVSATTNIISGAMRYVSTLAIHHNKTYRLIIDMDNAGFYTEAANTDDPCARYLPEGDAADPLSLEEEAEAEAEGEGRRVGLGEREDEARERAEAAFGADDSALLAETFQPETNVVRIVTEHHSEPQQGGKAAIYFYPSGRAERAMIWVGVAEDEDGETIWKPELTLELHALGRVTRYPSVIDEGNFMREIEQEAAE